MTTLNDKKHTIFMCIKIHDHVLLHCTKQERFCSKPVLFWQYNIEEVFETRQFLYMFFQRKEIVVSHKKS